MTTVFEKLMATSVLPREDARIAEALARRFGLQDGPALLALALALRAPTQGHVCIPLASPLEHMREVPDETRRALVLPDEATITRALLDSGLARRADDEGARPLVIDDGRLYLARYHEDELAIAAFVRARARRFAHIEDDEAARLAARLDALFESGTVRASAAQKRAVATALLRDFTLITGGPGTGKTTTVVRLLALLATRVKGLRVALLAPTGKAAARLAQSVRAQRLSLPEDVREDIPTDARTIHRTLGASQDGLSFKHDARTPLPVDVVVVDEASMVDLPLMARLFAAIPTDAKVILLGDRDQLTSVEAGAVLADLTADRDLGARLSRPFAASLARFVPVHGAEIGDATETSLADAVVALETSHRFDPSRGIGRLAAAIHAGDVDAALGVLALGEEAVGHDHDPRDVLPHALRDRLVSMVKARSTLASDRDALRSLDEARVLCALRKGPTGVTAMNERFGRWLEHEGIATRRSGLFSGLPVLVTRNDLPLGLFNGDIGVIRTEGETVRAVFEAEDGDGVRAFAPGRLPPWEPVHAMTVHKSQGSEVTEVVLVLPETPSPVVTRELLYTAITRARARVHVVAGEEVLTRAIRERVVRASGLRERLR